jgi:hypothetical protein
MSFAETKVAVSARVSARGIKASLRRHACPCPLQRLKLQRLLSLFRYAVAYFGMQSRRLDFSKKQPSKWAYTPLSLLCAGSACPFASERLNLQCRSINADGFAGPIRLCSSLMLKLQC